MSAAMKDRMLAIFGRGGLAIKSLDVFGRHCIVTCHCYDTALQVARCLQGAGWTVQGPTKGADEAVQNKGTCLKPTLIPVYRVGARVD